MNKGLVRLLLENRIPIVGKDLDGYLVPIWEDPTPRKLSKDFSYLEDDTTMAGLGRPDLDGREYLRGVLLKDGRLFVAAHNYSLHHEGVWDALKRYKIVNDTTSGYDVIVYPDGLSGYGKKEVEDAIDTYVTRHTTWRQVYE